MKKSLLALGLLAAVGLNSCKDDTTSPNDNGNTNKTATYYGSAQKIGNDSARTYVSVDSNGNPVAIGVAIDADAMTNLPADMTMLMLPMPNEGNSKLPFKVIGFDWNPNGHEPTFLFSAPHFDFHFYTMTESEIHNIMLNTPGDTAKMYKDPIASDVAPGYTGHAPVPNVGWIPTGGVPMMGWHFTDSTKVIPGPSWNFTQVFIYGYYNGKMNFLEPMITKAFLESKQSLTENIPQPQTYINSGNYWPTKYTIKFDAAANRYIVEMNGLVQR